MTRTPWYTWAAASGSSILAWQDVRRAADDGSAMEQDGSPRPAAESGRYVREDIREIPRSVTLAELERTDSSRDPHIRRRFPPVSSETIQVRHADECVGLLPTRVGDGFKFEEARVVAHAHNKEEFERQVQALLHQFPGLSITRRFIRAGGRRGDTQERA